MHFLEIRRIPSRLRAERRSVLGFKELGAQRLDRGTPNLQRIMTSQDESRGWIRALEWILRGDLDTVFDIPQGSCGGGRLQERQAPQAISPRRKCRPGLSTIASTSPGGTPFSALASRSCRWLVHMFTFGGCSLGLRNSAPGLSVTRICPESLTAVAVPEGWQVPRTASPERPVPAPFSARSARGS